MQLADLYVYPIKSTAGVRVQQSAVGPRGLRFDRHWVLMDDQKQIITAREQPELLRLRGALGESCLTISKDGEQQIEVPLEVAGDARQIEVQVFGAAGTGVTAEPAINQWFSDFLGVQCQLVFMSEASGRPVTEESGGRPGDVVSFADECPLMILSEGSLQELNAKLDHEVTMLQFRPNLVVSGCEASAEDSWQRIRIGECEFELLHRVRRCVFATINPDTHEPHEAQEPLRTLTTYRRHENGGVAFGRHLIARTYGTLKVGDEIEVI